jgi:hypothetical protein
MIRAFLEVLVFVGGLSIGYSIGSAGVLSFLTGGLL